MSTSNPNPVNIAVEFMDKKFLIESHTIDLVYSSRCPIHSFHRYLFDNDSL